MLNNSIIPVLLSNSYVMRILFASILGAAIGIERDIHGRAAGLRTNLLVSLGAAVFTIISEVVAFSFSPTAGNLVKSADPGRIAAQIVTGIGFIGAGAIIKSGFSIRGLTTATCIWLSAAIGMSCGIGHFELAIITAAIGLFSLTVLNKFEGTLKKDSYRTLVIVTTNDVDVSEPISIVKRDDVKIVYLEKERNYVSNEMTLEFTLRLSHKGVTDKLSHEIVQAFEMSTVPLKIVKWRK